MLLLLLCCLTIALNGPVKLNMCDIDASMHIAPRIAFWEIMFILDDFFLLTGFKLTVETRKRWRLCWKPTRYATLMIVAGVKSLTVVTSNSRCLLVCDVVAIRHTQVNFIRCLLLELLHHPVFGIATLSGIWWQVITAQHNIASTVSVTFSNLVFKRRWCTCHNRIKRIRKYCLIVNWHSKISVTSSILRCLHVKNRKQFVV